MKTIDSFFAKHQVDVGKSLGLISLMGAVVSLYGMLGELLIGRVNIDLSGPFGIVIGMALWRHASWSRTFLLVICWVAVVLLSVFLVAVPFTGTAYLTLTLGSTTIEHPSLWQFYVVTVFMAPAVWFMLSVLYSEKAKEEFQNEPNQAPEPTPTAVTPPAGQEARQP